MRCVSVAEQNGSCTSVVEVEPLTYHCSTGVMVAVGEAHGKCACRWFWITLVIVEAGLRCLRRKFPRFSQGPSYEGRPPVTVAGGRRQKTAFVAARRCDVFARFMT